MDNTLIRLQMRKIGYNKLGKQGIALAEKEYSILCWFQSLYDSNCLSGDFYTCNIVKETWDAVCRNDDPLARIDEGYQNLIEQARDMIMER